MPKAFLDYLAFERNLSEHTITAYKTDLNQFESFCKAQNINNLLSVNPKDIRQWIIFLLNQQLTSITVHRKVSSLKAFYKFHLKAGKIKDNPAVYVTLPKKQSSLPHFVKEAEVDTFFQSNFFNDDFEGQRDQNIVHLFYLTGMRRQELINLKISDIDFKRKVISILGKRNKNRYAPLPNWLLEQLNTYINMRNELSGTTQGFLFLTAKGTPVYPKLVYRIVKYYISMVASLQKRSPHVLRHTFATQMLNSGADLNAIKELLGHANLAATEIYTHNSFEKLKKTYKQAHPRA